MHLKKQWAEHVVKYRNWVSQPASRPPYCVACLSPVLLPGLPAFVLGPRLPPPPAPPCPSRMPAAIILVCCCLQVKVRYVGKLKSNGKVFDRSPAKPFSFRLGGWQGFRGSGFLGLGFAAQ